MMQRTKSICGVLLVAGVVLSAYAMFSMAYACLFSIQRITFTLDPLFAPSIQQSIATFFIHQKPALFSSMPSNLHQLMQQFPCIAECSCSYVAPHGVHCQVTAHKPLLTINKEQVLTASGLAMTKDYFALYRLASLHEVKSLTASSSAMHAKLLDMAQTLPPHIYHQFSVCWVDEFEIWFTEKKEKSFSIIASLSTLPTDQLLHHCFYAKDQQRAQDNERKIKKEKHLIADVRFNKQIIMYANEGGNVYG